MVCLLMPAAVATADSVIDDQSRVCSRSRMPSRIESRSNTLDASAYGGASLPVIGHSLDAGAKIVDKINTNFVDPLNDLATALEG